VHWATGATRKPVASVPDLNNGINVAKGDPAVNKTLVRGSYLIIFLLCIPLFFIGLGNPPLIDPDEPVYAATGRTMLLSGHFAGWWSPHYNGALWFDKPPMTYWLIGLSMKLFGGTALAARFPSAVCALLLVILTGVLCKRLWPRTVLAGFWASIAIATCVQTVILARAAVTDMILALLLTMALIGLWNWLIDERDLWSLVLMGAATGLSTLTKGPVAIVLVGGTVLFFLLITKQASRLRNPFLWLSLFVALLISLPWYLSMIHEHGNLFVQGFLEANNLTRYVHSEHPQTSSPLWFAPVLLGFIFPWTVPLLFSVWAAVRSARAGDRGALLAIIWIGWVFVFFSASQTKLLTYIYPLYPAAAVLIGRWVDSGPSRKERIACGVVFATVAALIAILLPGYVSRGNGLVSARSILEQIGLVFALSGIVCALVLLPAFERSSLTRQVVFIVSAVAIAAFFALVAIAPIWKQDLPDLSMRRLGSQIKRLTPAGNSAIALALKKPSLVFYSSRNIDFIEDRKMAVAAMKKRPYSICIIKDTSGENPLVVMLKLFPPGTCKILSQSSAKYVLIKYQG
jgi:4-amino-4-deoxy-L-arabinose transferase-like glycosyltransferase